MARITQEQYNIKDLELKSNILKELKVLNKIMAYRFGPGAVQLLEKIKEDLEHEFEDSRS